MADIQKAAQKKDPLRYWVAPFRWGPRSRYGPPLERLIPLMSTTEVLTVPVSGSKVEADKLWPECYELGSWTDAGEPARWGRHVEATQQFVHMMSGPHRAWELVSQ